MSYWAGIKAHLEITVLAKEGIIPENHDFLPEFHAANYRKRGESWEEYAERVQNSNVLRGK